MIVLSFLDRVRVLFLEVLPDTAAPLDHLGEQANGSLQPSDLGLERLHLGAHMVLLFVGLGDIRCASLLHVFGPGLGSVGGGGVSAGGSLGSGTWLRLGRRGWRVRLGVRN